MPGEGTQRLGSGSVRVWRVCAVLTALAVPAALIGCSRASLPHTAAAPASASAPRAGASDPTDATANLVSAVGPRANAPLSVRFRLGARPVLGMPLQILVTVTASGEQINRLHGMFFPDSGLTLQSDRSFEATDLAAGVTLQRQVTVIPKQPGVQNVTAAFTVDLESGSMSVTYAIPIIVNDNSS